VKHTSRLRRGEHLSPIFVGIYVTYLPHSLPRCYLEYGSVAQEIPRREMRQRGAALLCALVAHIRRQLRGPVRARGFRDSVAVEGPSGPHESLLALVGVPVKPERLVGPADQHRKAVAICGAVLW
jgi:hypothetical protein